MSSDYDRAVQREIEKANYQIENLGDERNRYQNMKNRINNEVIPKLRRSKNYIIDAKAKLKSNYDSQEANKRSNNLQTYAERIDAMMNTLNNVIIPAIERNINSTNSQIESARADLNRYRDMLNN